MAKISRERKEGRKYRYHYHSSNNNNNNHNLNKNYLLLLHRKHRGVSNGNSRRNHGNFHTIGCLHKVNEFSNTHIGLIDINAIPLGIDYYCYNQYCQY